MTVWRKVHHTDLEGMPKKNGRYLVCVRYKGCNYAETEALFSTNMGGIWANMNIPSNDFDEIVWWHDPNDPNDTVKCNDSDSPSMI